MSEATRHTMTIQQLLELVSGNLLSGDPQTEVKGLNSISEAQHGDVTFLGNTRYAAALAASRASAVLVPVGFQATEDDKAYIAVENPTLAFSRVIRQFGPKKPTARWGINDLAMVDPSAKFDPEHVSIGLGVYIGEGAVIGRGTILWPGCFVGAGAVLGENCELHPNVVIRERCILGNRVVIHSGSVIGSDGFGYEMHEGRHVKIEQVGIVQIEDDVEIGSCTTIDRARFGRTLIGEGTKIDNLVQIGHNCVLGRHCIIVSQTGISGSTRIGDNVTMGGQVGVAGHLVIGDRVILLAKSGVTKSIPEPGAYTGYPAKPLMEGRKMLTYPARVPELMDRVKKLEQRLAALEQGEK
jgi:UDP-3-O-[3-hydroxymyristoyl] glucosamine N-acyltransferase